MGIFDTIANADASSNTGVYIQPGDYLLGIQRVSLFASKQDGSDVFVVEGKVLEVLLKYEASNRVGETVSMIRKASKNPKGFASDAKAFIAAAAEISFDQVTANVVQRAVANDGAMFAGMTMHAHAFNRETKNGGNFTVVQWSVPSESDDIPVE